VGIGTFLISRSGKSAPDRSEFFHRQRFCPNLRGQVGGFEGRHYTVCGVPCGAQVIRQRFSLLCEGLFEEGDERLLFEA
jgi:hypothetical protein